MWTKKSLRKTDREEIFKGIALYGNTDAKTAQDVYYGLVRFISHKLKEKQSVGLPDLGEFYLYHSRPRTYYPIKKHKDGTWVKYTTPSVNEWKTMVKFKPNYKIKKWFHDYHWPNK